MRSQCLEVSLNAAVQSAARLTLKGQGASSPVQCGGFARTLYADALCVRTREPALPRPLVALPVVRPTSAAPAASAVISFDAPKNRRGLVRHGTQFSGLGPRSGE